MIILHVPFEKDTHAVCFPNIQIEQSARAKNGGYILRKLKFYPAKGVIWAVLSAILFLVLTAIGEKAKITPQYVILTFLFFLVAGCPLYVFLSTHITKNKTK